jgi:ABC-2 type transport system permease protein
VIEEVIEAGWAFGDVWVSFPLLACYSAALLLLASLTLRENE